MVTLTPPISQKVFLSVFRDAITAANIAGDEWMKNAKPRFSIHNSDILTHENIGAELGTMLDLCGNAHLKFNDRRSAWFKVFTKFGKITETDSSIIYFNYKYSSRQEYGLKVECVNAAKRVFEQFGITGIRVLDYVD